LIRHKASVDWHRELIAELRKCSPLAGLGVSALLSRQCCFEGIRQAPDCQVVLCLVLLSSTSYFQYAFEAVESCSQAQEMAYHQDKVLHR
jgi:hypothetical protein